MLLSWKTTEQRSRKITTNHNPKSNPVQLEMESSPVETGLSNCTQSNNPQQPQTSAQQSTQMEAPVKETVPQQQQIRDNVGNDTPRPETLTTTSMYKGPIPSTGLDTNDKELGRARSRSRNQRRNGSRGRGLQPSTLTGARTRSQSRDTEIRFGTPSQQEDPNTTMESRSTVPMTSERTNPTVQIERRKDVEEAALKTAKSTRSDNRPREVNRRLELTPGTEFNILGSTELPGDPLNFIQINGVSRQFLDRQNCLETPLIWMKFKKAGFRTWANRVQVGVQ